MITAIFRPVADITGRTRIHNPILLISPANRRVDCPIAVYVGLTAAVVVSLATPQLAGFGWSRNIAHPIRAVWGDLDGDGRDDQLHIEQRDSTTRIDIELSSGTTAPTLETSYGQSIVTVADIDGDGDLDVVTASPVGSSELWLNDGRGRLTLSKRTAPTSSVVPLTVTSNPRLAFAAWRTSFAWTHRPMRARQRRAASSIRAPADTPLARGLRSTVYLRGPPHSSLSIA